MRTSTLSSVLAATALVVLVVALCASSSAEAKKCTGIYKDADCSNKCTETQYCDTLFAMDGYYCCHQKEGVDEPTDSALKKAKVYVMDPATGELEEPERIEKREEL